VSEADERGIAAVSEAPIVDLLGMREACMTEGITNLAGIEIPSADPLFLAVVGIHVMLGIAGTITGAIAMLSQKHAGQGLS
jgi:hypothetical protein